MSTLWIILGIFVLGLMVLVHEWGHFIVAKLLGVRVETFSIGFGPRLWGVRRGPTDYRLSVLPLGGYVKMAGDNPALERAGAPDEFLSKPRWQRALIVAAGPVTNVILAFVLLAGLYMVRYDRPSYLAGPPQLAGTVAGSPAEKAGLRAGDVVLSVDGKPNPTWEDLQVQAALAGNQPLPVTVQRGAEKLSLIIHPEVRGSRDTGYVGWYPYNPVVVANVDPNMPAAQAGLQKGDEIVAVNGRSTSSIGDAGFVAEVQKSKGQPVALTVKRDAATLDLSVTPKETTWRGKTGYLVGIEITHHMIRSQLSPAAAVVQSYRDNLRFGWLLFDVLGRLFSGRASVRMLEGPIGIVVISGQAASLGWPPLLTFMAIISINLAVLNVLPVPILDGGHIAFLLIEGARRRDLSMQVKEIATQIGFALLMLLFVVVMYNDIVRYIFQ